MGSTALAKSLDPEELNDVTRGYYESCTSAIAQFDGLVANYIGDGIMALFGYPRAHEDDAERATHAALGILRAVRSANSTGKVRVHVRVGIATGLVVVGEDGAQPLTKEKTVVGEAPNLAAHLQSATQPDTILISDATRQLLGDVFLLEELKLSRLKEITTGPVTAWRVIGPKQTASRFTAHVVHLTDFVGRDEEVALLVDRWQQAKEGEGQLVLLSGEAGIGKSRIVERFRQLISKEPHISLEYQCSPYHVDSALYPVINQLEHALEFAAEDSTTIKLGKLEALLERKASALDEVLPLFAELLSIPTGERYPPPDPDPQRRKERLLNALIDQLAAAAQERPVLLTLEDAHWADPTTLDLFGRAILRFPDMCVLLITTYRPEFQPPWTGLSQVTALLLNRLRGRHCRAMIESIARCKSMPDEVVEQIVAKTDGVPLFVEELTKTVLESGLLEEKDSAWLLRGTVSAFAIPATLQDSLMARLDRLSSVKPVAQIGGVIGREFCFALIAAVSLLRENELQDALAKLTSSELVFSRGVPPAATYIFKHALVRDAAYETLLKSQRQHLHERIAKILENSFFETAEAQPESSPTIILMRGTTKPPRSGGTRLARWRSSARPIARRRATSDAPSSCWDCCRRARVATPPS